MGLLHFLPFVHEANIHQSYTGPLLDVSVSEHDIRICYEGLEV